MSMSGSSASKRRERFHGAFTGGFSAGFYNTVGSAEGWTPSSFSSSRNKRAERLEQRPEDFMDDDDGLLTEQLQARPEFDTLGSTANEIARRLTNGEEACSTIPGPVPSELVVPVGDTMGKRLLRTMGWKEGQGVGSRVKRKRRRFLFAQDDDNDDQPLERDLPKGARTGLGKKAQELIEKEGLTFAPHNIDFKAESVVVKSNVHGVGYDPFKGAPEFGVGKGSLAAIKSPTIRGSGTYSTMDIVQWKSNARAGGGAVSAISQKPHATLSLLRGSQGFILDDGEDHVYEQNLGKEDYDASLDADGGDRADESRDSLVHYAKAWASETSAESEVMLSSRRYARCPSDGRLPPKGFVVACKPDEIHKYWAPPIPPADFKPSFPFEEDTAHRDIPTNEGRSFMALDASGRGRLLGEAKIPTQDDTPPIQGSSTLSFLPPVARKTLLEAASKGRISGSSSSKGTAAPSPSREASSSYRSGGLHVTLANRFISETSKADDNPPTAVNGLVSAAGLKLRTSAPTGATDSPPRVTISTAKNTASEAKRSTFDWRPTSLLCKRLNVPAPDGSSTQGLTSKGKRQSGGQASGGELIDSEPFQRFTSESSISTMSNRPKVPLLHEAEAFPPETTPSNGASTMVDQVNTGKLPERPSVDLFKSIFESESESESDEGDKSDGDHSFPKDTDPVSSLSATHVELKEALQASSHKLLPQRGYGSDSSEECASDSGLPTPSVAQSTIEGSKAKGSLPDDRSHDGPSEATLSNRQERNRNEMKRSGEKRKHKLDSKHSSKRKKDKSEKKHRKHGHKHKSSSRKEHY